ncbi:hypothetical protein QBC43DRAFT_46769 [Cladorrhinum sp. PSN259]|nr:hypothetical protein QBC43DRAFT_46769 [Cladorrhinum sp. PSN259]
MSTREPSSEPPKPSKRKGTRSVSTLTPTQLARKRANDREAQRAIRARTKEHIERLEHELAEYKASKTDDAFQKLMRRNKELEDELRESRNTIAWLQRCQNIAFEADGLPNVNGHGFVSRPPSFGQGVGDYQTTASGYPTSYLPTPEPCPEWNVVSVMPPVPSTVSSPGSSAGHTEDYQQMEYPAITPTSVPGTMMSVVMPPTSMAGSIPATMATSIPSPLDPTSAEQLKYESLDPEGMGLPPSSQPPRMQPRISASSSSSSRQDCMFSTNRGMLSQAADHQGYHPNVSQSSAAAAASYLQHSAAHGWAPAAAAMYSTPGYYTTAAPGQAAAL